MAKQIRFMETVLRDGQQSQIATRMPIEDMLPILETLDACGFESLEVWGGATFDSCLRYLNEDPWERLRTIRAHVKHTKLQMLLRGQNLLGYRNYADDVVEALVKKSVENGIHERRAHRSLLREPRQRDGPRRRGLHLHQGHGGRAHPRRRLRARE